MKFRILYEKQSAVVTYWSFEDFGKNNVFKAHNEQ